jgi:hypothetical protein
VAELVVQLLVVSQVRDSNPVSTNNVYSFMALLFLSWKIVSPVINLNLGFPLVYPLKGNGCRSRVNLRVMPKLSPTLDDNEFTVSCTTVSLYYLKKALGPKKRILVGVLTPGIQNP